MKLIVTTFLVYKVEKCLLKSGKVSLLKSRIVKEAGYQNMPKPWGIYAQSVGTQCPSRGETMPKPWATLLIVVSYSYCKLTIIFSIPNSTCQSSILFLLSIDIQNPFYKIKRQKKVGMGIKKRRKKKEKRNNSYSRRRVCNQEYKGEI